MMTAREFSRMRGLRFATARKHRPTLEQLTRGINRKDNRS